MRMLRNVRGLREVAYVNGGAALLSVDSDDVPRLWDLASFEGGRTLEGMEAQTARLLFVPNGEAFARAQSRWLGGPEIPLKGYCWPPRLVEAPPREGSEFHGFGLDGRSALWMDRGEWDDPLRLALWDFQGERRCSFLFPQPFGLKAASFSPDGTFLVAGGLGNDALLWRLAEGGDPAGQLWHTARVQRTAFTPDGRLLATAAGKTMRLWEVPQSATPHQFVSQRVCLHQFRAFATVIGCLTISPDGRLLAAGDNKSRVRLWEIATGREIGDYNWGIGIIGGVAFAPNGATAAAAGSGKAIVVWDVDV
jgi:WD40 repeat protein